MIVGIDPGKNGGVAYIHNGYAHAQKMPLAGKEIDGRALALHMIGLCPDLVILEKVGAMPGQGVTSMFTFGKGFGIVIGVLEALNIPYRLVTPQAWKKTVLAGSKKDKDAAINLVRRAYPTVELVPPRCRKPHDGMADAVCLAEFGLRLMVKERRHD